MTGVSVEMFEFSEDIDIDDIESTADGYTTTDSNPNLSDDLRIRTEDVERWSNPDALRFSIVFERPVKMSTWDDQSTWGKTKTNQSVIISEEIFGGGFLMIGGKEGRSTAISRLMDLVGHDNDDYEKIDISTNAIDQIVSQDAQSAASVAARDIDPHTDSGYAAGNVGQSRIARTVEGGQVTWKQISSQQFGGETIGIGTESIVTYGNGWDDRDRLDYVIDIVEPNL